MKEPIFEYFDIITNRLQNPLPKGEYGERHHIYPKSLGGWNLKCNIVKLTPEEHLRCHKLLPKILKELGDEFGYHKMNLAWHRTAFSTEGKELTEEEYAEIRKKAAEATSFLNTGKKRSKEFCQLMHDINIGKTLSEEHRKKISKTEKGRKFSEEHKRKISAALSGKPKPWLKGRRHSEETRKKQSEGVKKWRARIKENSK